MIDQSLTHSAPSAWPSDWRRHLVVLAIVAFGYIVVRVVIAPSGGFLRYHMTDLLCGFALPSVMALAIADERPLGLWIRSLRGTMILAACGTLVWEGLQPLVSARSTADPIDALCYLAGATLQHVAVARRA